VRTAFREGQISQFALTPQAPVVCNPNRRLGYSFSGNRKGGSTYNSSVYLITLFDGREAMFDFDDFDDDDFFTAIWYYARKRVNQPPQGKQSGGSSRKQGGSGSPSGQRVGFDQSGRLKCRK
jgi:hypothetical protein